MLYLGQECFWNWIHPIDTSNSEFSKIFDKHWVYLQKSFANFWSSSTATHTWKELFRANLQNEKKWKMNMNSFATLVFLSVWRYVSLLTNFLISPSIHTHRPHTIHLVIFFSCSMVRYLLLGAFHLLNAYNEDYYTRRFGQLVNWDNQRGN